MLGVRKTFVIGEFSGSAGPEGKSVKIGTMDHDMSYDKHNIVVVLCVSCVGNDRSVPLCK